MTNSIYYRNAFIFSDLIGSGLAWSLFFMYRKIFVETPKFGVKVPFHPNYHYFIGLLCIPLFWLILHFASGSYNDIRRKSQFQNTRQLLAITAIGTLFIFFTVILDDTVISYFNYYKSFTVLFFLQFLITWIPRTLILTIKNHKFNTKKDAFNTFIIGRSPKIKSFLSENKIWLDQSGLEVTGYSFTDRQDESTEDMEIASYPLNKLEAYISEKQIEDVILLLRPSEPELLENVLLQVVRYDVSIRISPNLYPLVNIPLKTNSIFQSPLFELSKDLPPSWHLFVKNMADIILSGIALILLSPAVLLLSVAIKLTSPGPILYSHIRIGKNGKPFKIYKFRSMYMDSETNGPQLSSRNDKRISPIGKIMRRRRLDEIPNFFNVLKGDMSLVGPRPERAFYIRQIIEQAPQYAKLHLVKPGITSWGQVKYGYAENVEEMVRRMRFDLVYIENMSLYVDFQILLKTISTIIKGQGV